MNSILFLILIVLSTQCIAQEYTLDSVVLKKDTKKGLKLFKKSEAILKKEISDYEGKYKTDFKKFNSERKSALNVYHQNIFFDDYCNDYITNILNKIISKNEELKTLDLRIHMLYDESENAFNSGEGSIFIHLGLFQIIENEAELTFIISHEIAHQYSNHISRSIKELFDSFYGDEIQEELEEIKSLGLERYKRFQNLIKNLNLDNSRHSRTHEFEADSLAGIYIKHTDYNYLSAIKAIDHLKLADDDSIDIFEIIHKNFNHKTAPLDSILFKENKSLRLTMKEADDKEMRDSLRTHPDTDIRYLKLKLTEVVTSGTNKSDTPDQFQKIKLIANYQSIQYLLESNKISRAIFYILKMKDKGESSPFLDKKLVQCIQLLKDKLDNHTFGLSIDSRNIYSPREYDKLLLFLNNLNFQDFDLLISNYKLNNNL